MDITTPIALVDELEVWLSRRDRSTQAMGDFGLSLTAQRLKQASRKERDVERENTRAAITALVVAPPDGAAGGRARARSSRTAQGFEMSPAMHIRRGAGRLPRNASRGSSVRGVPVHAGGWLAGPMCNGVLAREKRAPIFRTGAIREFPITLKAESARQHRLVAQHVSHPTCKVFRGTLQRRWGMGLVLHFDASRLRSFGSCRCGQRSVEDVRLRQPHVCGEHSIGDSVRQFVGPLGNGGSGDANRLGSVRDGSTEELNGVRLVHSDIVSVLTDSVKPANTISGLNAAMTLQERLEELMKEKGWDHADLMRVSGQSSSVVSQWLGNGSKAIKTIGKIEAAMRIAEETGYSATWIAKGIPPKRLPAVQMAVGTGKTAAAIKVMEHLRGAEPPSPPSEFADRHEVSDSDWALLQDIKDAMAHSRLAKQVEGIRTEVAELREFANNVMAKRAQGEGAPPKTEQFVNKQQRAARKARA